MFHIFRTFYFSIVVAVVITARVKAEDDLTTIELWSEFAPGETTANRGEALPVRPDEKPPATRITNITFPTMRRFNPPEGKENGTSVLILPGGGYRYCVIDKEGSEIAKWLNGHGVTAFVLRYRTTDNRNESPWKRPVEDALRAIRMIRSHAQDWKLNPNRVGIIGFSAGGQAAAIASTKIKPNVDGEAEKLAGIDARPDFTMLIYPWRLLGETGEELRAENPIDENTPTTFLVHTHDDSSTSLGSIAFYSALKNQKIPAELHIYQSGGHGYGLRPVSGSDVHTWPERAAVWLKNRGLLDSD